MSMIDTARAHAGFAAAIGLALTGALGPSAAASAANASNTDVTFLVSVHQANLTEISASENARANATGGCVRMVAEMLVRDHRRLDAAGGQLAARLGVALPGAPTAGQQRLLAALASANGTAGFDSMWLMAQQSAHQGALNLLDHEIAHGTDPLVVEAASTARPVVAGHLEMVRGGTCHQPSLPAMVNAGDGGQAAAAAAERGREPLAAALVGLGLFGVATGVSLTVRRRHRAAVERTGR